MKKFLKAFAIASIILLFIFDILNYSFMQIQINYLAKEKISYFEYRFPTFYYLFQPDRKINRYYTRLIKDGFADVVGNGNVKTSRLIRALQKRNRILPHYYDEILYFWNKELAPYNKIHSKKELKHRLYLYEDRNKHAHYYQRTKALHQAKDRATIKALIAQGATINDLDRQQNHILHFVKDSTLAKFIVAMGGSINTQNMFRHTPLIEAIKKYQKTKNSEYLKIIKLFLNRRADIRKALKFTQDIEVAKLLIKYGANVNETDLHGISVLHYLLRTNNHAIIEFLIDSGANINHQDNLRRSLLHRTTNPKIITLLLQKGINTNLRNKHGKTAVEHWKYKYEAMKNYPRNVYKKSHHDAYLKAIETYKEYFNPTQKIKTIKPTKVKPTPTPKPKELKSLLDCDTLEEIQKIIAQDKPTFDRSFGEDYKYNSAVEFFLRRYQETNEEKYLQISQSLIASGAIPNVEKIDETTLSLLITDKTRKPFEVYLNRTVDNLSKLSPSRGIEFGDIYPPTKNRKTYLEILKKLLKFDLNTSGLLFKTQDEEIATILLEHGADINEKNEKGVTPLLYHLIKQTDPFIGTHPDNPDFIRFLREHGAVIFTYTIDLDKDPLEFMTHHPGLSVLMVGNEIFGVHFAIYTYIKDKLKIDNNIRYEFNINAEITSTTIKPRLIDPLFIPINILPHKSNYDKNSTDLSEKKVFYEMFFDSQDFIQSLYKKSEKQSNNIEPKKVKPLFKCKTLEEVKEAIRHGESIEKSFHFGMKPLKFFIKLYKETQNQNYYEIAQYLYDQGAKPNIDSAYLNILLRLVKKENQKHFIEAIIKDSPLYQSPLNNLKALLKDDFNTSGLLFMTQYDDIGELLLKHGADVNEKDEAG